MRVLFVPVSSSKGIGEYMRSLILAQAVQEAFSNAETHFVLSEEAPYVEKCPYPVLITPRSATYHVAEVNAYIDKFKPDVVVFDASGRAKQIKHAKKAGAKTLFIAQHNKKIKRGFKLNRLIYTDAILIAQPKFAVSNLSYISYLKLKLLKKTPPKYLDSIFASLKSVDEAAILKKYNLAKDNYIFASAGSGGHKFHTGKLAAEQFNIALEDARRQTEGVMPYLQVWGANYPNKNLPLVDQAINLRNVTNLEFIVLLKNSYIALINGGDTLLQALSLKVPCVVVPVSSDQPQRIRKIKKYSSCFLESGIQPQEITEQLLQLLSVRTRLLIKEQLAVTEVNNGVDIFLNKLRAYHQKS